MISLKYKKMYDIFIKHYKEKHVNPWHEINEKELKSIFDNIVNTQDINDDYSFNYLMNYIIKRLSGISDAHTGFMSSFWTHFFTHLNTMLNLQYNYYTFD